MTRYLLDTSAFWQARINSTAGLRIKELGLAESIAACTPAILEMMLVARNLADWRAMRAAFDGMPRVDLSNPADAIDLQGQLARRGQHRTPVIDVLVAATALQHELTVLHYDRNFERLTEATGGTHEWVVPAGSGH